MNNLTINYDTFQKPKFVGALIMILFGLAFLDEYETVGIFLLVTSIIPPFYNDGIELDLEQNRYRYFTSYFGLKRGVWYSLSKYNCVLIKLQRGTREIIGARGAIATSFDEQQYEVAIGDETHRKQLMLKHFTGKEAAFKLAKKVSNSLDFPIETYNPKLSTKTKERRKKKKN